MQILEFIGDALELVGLLPGELKGWLEENGEPAYRYKQIFDWLYKKTVFAFDEMANLPKSLREKLAASFSLPSLTLMTIEDSADEETTKFLWKLRDGKLVESVLISSGDRRTVCVSSQVGCPARCAFCASGKEGLIRNLTAGEIHEQVLQIQAQLKKKGEHVSHIVFMGMGEPLDNYDQVVKALRLLTHPLALNLSPRRITVSTVGVVEGIEKLMDEEISVNLALSLHAPNQNLRKKIVPYSRKYLLEDILKAVDLYSKKTKRDLTYEYVLLKGINDSRKEAQELGELLKGQHCCVNLIPYNPVDGLNLKRPEKESIEAFREILDRAGIRSTWRYTKGKDIAAACGQLALKKMPPKEEALITL
ncbi:23S rRNA (adenine(2503)-C(2))-methyltransferase RlmN [Simkania negevensis]|uniref:Probable dual-specificity RNA methyltransferase RlmN n=1 Tax=Simkania negevensis (strain ATCC VR-1471 / DSM 27360 / Z) TaxID=331113 RepID=F8L357_SIMNZ|nr:23S rRNA (adenine(2503)-C(2))-methyltransferase RlmN [Simkania negevensis]CCB89695.1 ribosomal RNA large subunit methyltransferase N 2 [Simkania negevensis Z]